MRRVGQAEQVLLEVHEHGDGTRRLDGETSWLPHWVHNGKAVRVDRGPRLRRIEPGLRVCEATGAVYLEVGNGEAAYLDC